MGFIAAFLILVGSLLNPALIGHAGHVSGHARIMDGGGIPADGGGTGGGGN